MTTLQPKTTLSYSFCFWFLLRCHVYCCWCTSIFSLSLYLSLYLSLFLFCFGVFSVLFCFWKKPWLFTYHLLTKVCYKTFLTVLEAWSQQHARWKKIFLKSLSSHTVRLPSSSTFTPSQREQNIFMFTYAIHLDQRGRAENQKWGTCTVCV